MIDRRIIANAFGIDVVESSYMKTSMQKWNDMYLNQSAWITSRVNSLELPSAIASEFARLTLTEFSAKIKDELLNNQFQQFISDLCSKLEIFCAFGGLLLKPYNSNGSVMTDIVTQNNFIPVSYDSNIMTGVICHEYLMHKGCVYIHLEYHQYNPSDRTHTIKNLCYRSSSVNMLGDRCNLQEVPQWADLQEIKVYTAVKQPLFSFVKMPFSNNIDLNSPLGISVFSKSEDLIKQADLHWERILWEFESSERAIDATEDIFRMKDGKPQLPKGRERMFRTYEMQVATGKPFIETFSPEIRDNSLFNGLNRIFQRIEFNCGLAYGTISDISNVEKTAEEIKTSKQRSYTNICGIQRNLHTALEQLAYCYGYYYKYYNGFNADISLTCTFGDSVLEDTEKEYQRRLQMVTAQMLSKEKFIAWYFGCTEEEAINYLPVTGDLFGGGA